MADKIAKKHILAIISTFDGQFTLADITAQLDDIAERTLRHWLA